MKNTIILILSNAETSVTSTDSKMTAKTDVLESVSPIFDLVWNKIPVDRKEGKEKLYRVITITDGNRIRLISKFGFTFVDTEGEFLPLMETLIQEIKTHNTDENVD